MWCCKIEVQDKKIILQLQTRTAHVGIQVKECKISNWTSFTKSNFARLNLWIILILSKWHFPWENDYLEFYVPGLVFSLQKNKTLQQKKEKKTTQVPHQTLNLVSETNSGLSAPCLISQTAELSPIKTRMSNLGRAPCKSLDLLGLGQVR